jgi:hypothetical protein
MSKNKQRLINEYNQLCEDWRKRDQDVLQKFIPESVFFASVVIGVTQIQNSGFLMLIIFILFFGSFLFSFVIAFSIRKDRFYIKGTEMALAAVAKELHIDKTLAKITGKKITEFKMPRKIRIDSNLVSKISAFCIIEIVQWIMTLSFLFISIISFGNWLGFWNLWLSNVGKL